jgi:hypothetical protein
MQHRSCHRAALRRIGGCDDERIETTGATRSLTAGGKRDAGATGRGRWSISGGALRLGGENRPARETPMASVVNA